MELEFDKEIDAILRKAQPTRGVLVGDDPADPKKHLDGDTIAAFAENALPEKAKLLYVAHFADCDHCRKQLSFVMQMNNEAAAVVAPSPAVERAIEPTIPWYRRILKVPNLALAMGALVLVFSGVLGYLMMQKQTASNRAVVSQAEAPDRGQPALNRQSGLSNQTSANAMAPAANTAANSESVLQSGRGPNTESDNLGRLDTAEKPAAPAKSGQFQPDGASGSENSFNVDGQEAGRAQTQTKPAAPPPPVTTDTTASGIAMERDEKKGDAAKLKEESKDLEPAKQRSGENRGVRDMPRAASKIAPSRAGLAQNQLSSNTPVTRIIGGKTFNNRDGAWYDSAYHGQATANFRRDTTEYKKLDSRLRGIADTVGGTVVIVWKAKAYRIQ